MGDDVIYMNDIDKNPVMYCFACQDWRKVAANDSDRIREWCKVSNQALFVLGNPKYMNKGIRLPPFDKPWPDFAVEK